MWRLVEFGLKVVREVVLNVVVVDNARLERTCCVWRDDVGLETHRRNLEFDDDGVGVDFLCCLEECLSIVDVDGF